MILTHEIDIKVNESNYQYYEDRGYEVSIGETITIPIAMLPKGSHYKILCECDGDGCAVQKEVIYKNYLKYGNEWGTYYCRKCSEEKRKKTLRMNYGVDYPIQNKNLMEKMKQTILEKHGVDNISKKEKKK